MSQKEISCIWKCNKNTVGNILALCKEASREAMEYLSSSKRIPTEMLEKGLFDFLRNRSRKPNSNKRCFTKEEEEEIEKRYFPSRYGPKRMVKHLIREGLSPNVYTFAKLKGLYKRKKWKTKKIRTVNGERRKLYEYAKIGAFEYLQYDTKKITDKHALPFDIYERFSRKKDLPIYQWTIVDAKTRIRFLAWSHSLSSFYGLKFLEVVIFWLRSWGIHIDIHVQFDGGAEFCSASKRKRTQWNQRLSPWGVTVCDTYGVKWKQNLVERTHRIDDEEFYCPRGKKIYSKKDFLYEAQTWIWYYNNRPSGAIGLEGMTPKEKLLRLGVVNADAICTFPCMILEDIWEGLVRFPKGRKSENVLTPYLVSKFYLKS
ncbi:MAG: hypothetical protein EOM19_05430 [Candidatus Moranbacteria bacterium]|nr:hypothetical protein [Candidatus Moranbacteria bacterium]